MPSRGLYVLFAVTALAVIACGFAIDQRYRSAEREQQEGGLVFPEFQHQFSRITDIEVSRADGRFVLSRRQDAWANMGVGGFPALSKRVERAILAMAGLKYIAPRTGRSRLYHRLAVEDVTAEAESTRLTFRDASGAVLADLIVGKSQDGLDRQGGYIRLPDDARAWLAAGVPDVRYDAADWSNRAVVDFEPDAVTALAVRRAGGGSVFLRRNHPRDRKLTLQNLPSGAVVKHQYQIDYMAGLLQDLRFIDARRAGARLLAAPPAFEAVVHWKQHLAVTLLADQPLPDGSVWTQIDARAIDDSAPNAVKREVARIQSRFNGWSIRLPRKFSDKLKIRLDDIVKPQ